jgi:FkbM family methyltransferase
MNTGAVKEIIQRTFNRFGLQIRRVDTGVSYIDPYIEQLRLLKNHPVKVVFEVGAADGRDCLKYAELFPDAQIIAFEPVPSSFAKLQDQVKSLGDRISINNVALCDAPGTAEFNIAEWDDASSLLKSNQTGSTFDVYNTTRHTIQVSTESIDNYVQKTGITRIDLLKMDAQGAELSILKGAENQISKGYIPLIYTEVSFLEIYQGVPTFETICTYLKERGYKLHNLYGLNTNQKGELAWGDAIFVRNTLNP